MSALAVAGATAISTGIALPFIGKREPRYRILDKSNPLASYEVKIYVQTKVCGVWWTLYKRKHHFFGHRAAILDGAKKWLKDHLNGITRPPGVVFDTKLDDLGAL